MINEFKMATEYTYNTFSDILNGIFEHARQPLTDVNLVKKVKRFINGRYLQVQAYRKWKWRKEERSLKINKYYAGSQCTVTQNSRVLTVSDTTTRANAEDFVGRKFYIPGQREVYQIIALPTWTAPVSTFTLNVPFIGTTKTNVKFRIYQDEYGMWPDFEEFEDVVNQYGGKEVRRVGPAELMRYYNSSPFMEGKARCISTTGIKKYEGQRMSQFVMGKDFMGRGSAKKARIFPAINSEDYFIPVSFIKRAQSLIEDTDKPLMQPDDRIILYLGGLADLYGMLKDDSETKFYEAKFSAKLDQMANDDQEDDDRPCLSPNLDYRTRHSRGLSGMYDFGDTDGDIITGT